MEAAFTCFRPVSCNYPDCELNNFRGVTCGYKRKRNCHKSVICQTMLLKLVVCLFIGSPIALIRADGDVLVEIDQGKVQGHVRTSIVSQKPYYSFSGIPYAKTIDESSRFKSPEPPEPWSGVYQAYSQRSECPQFCPLRERFVGSDDCLFLHVYTPELGTNAPKPVMVWIHGGGFNFGSTDRIVHGPDYLMEQDVVVVTVAYRLGVLGFLSTEDSAAPGNVGLKDQVAALRWVKKNIQHFGGCPETITIFGCSAGGASVLYHMMSPMSHGLFKYAISQSGSPLNSWAFNPNPRESSFKLGRHLGIDTTDSDVLVKKLLEVPTVKIIEATRKLDSTVNWMNGNLFTFVPSVEPSATEGEEVFLPATPWSLIAAGKVADVPYISGLTLNESLFMKFVLGGADQMNNNFDIFIPDDLNATDTAEREKIASSIKKFYFGDEPLTKNSVDGFTQMMGDLQFNYGVQTTLRVMNLHRSSPIFNYVFAHEDAYGVFKNLKIFDVHEGAVHADDLGYEFYPRLLKAGPVPGSVEAKVIRLFTKLWANFAKTGNPTSNLDDDVTMDWKPFGKERNYAIIDQTLTMDQDLFKERISFWMSLYENALRGFENLF